MNRRSFLLSSLAACAATKVPPMKPEPTKRVLILGGTGYIGPHIVRAFLARGHTVTLFNRGKTHTELFPELEKLRGDRDGHLEALANRSWDAVIDPSGFVPRIVTMSAQLLAPRSSTSTRSTAGPTCRCGCRPPATSRASAGCRTRARSPGA